MRVRQSHHMFLASQRCPGQIQKICVTQTATVSEYYVVRDAA